MSWKTPKRQLFILNCILYSRSLWHYTRCRWSGQPHQAQTRVHQWIHIVRIFTHTGCKIAWHYYNSIGSLLPSSVSSNLERQRPKPWFWTLPMKWVERIAPNWWTFTNHFSFDCQWYSDCNCIRNDCERSFFLMFNRSPTTFYFLLNVYTSEDSNLCRCLITILNEFLI